MRAVNFVDNIEKVSSAFDFLRVLKYVFKFLRRYLIKKFLSTILN